MNCQPTKPRFDRGIALVIVMLVIVVLTILAAGFAYSMKVEVKLARNAQNESEMLWLAWSGVELARYAIGQQANIPGEEGFHALNQKWAGGPGGTNDLLADLSLENVELGRGRFTVRIADLERKISINTSLLARRDLLEQVLQQLGVDALDAATIADSIDDWRDPDQNPQLNGAESDYYLSLKPPYWAKDGPIDDISELLLVRGVTPELYWGFDLAETRSSSSGLGLRGLLGPAPDHGRAPGLADLFDTHRSRQVNINTASLHVLRLLPGIDENLAEGIIQERAGDDHIDGTADDTPFHTAGELINVAGMLPQFVQALTRICTTRSIHFRVEVEVEVDQYRRTFEALLVTAGQRGNILIINGRWK